MVGNGPVANDAEDDAEDDTPNAPPPSSASSQSAPPRSGLTPRIAGLDLNDILPLHQKRLARRRRRILPPLRHWTSGPWDMGSRHLGPGQTPFPPPLPGPTPPGASNLNLHTGYPWH
ncbi:hypothetical protein N7486_008827 [Penicillium sp. IBT 16267x]|nr:hypothetical protein N7486_008827 [Penicillium sp. IBT 16267x]